MEIILDVQGFKKPDNEFVVKELAAIKIQRNKEGYQEAGCVLLKPPCEWNSLPAKYKSMNLWCERNYHGIPWNTGDIPYDELKELFNIILKDVGFIYVKGLEKKEWIEHIIGRSTPIVNMEDFGCPALRELSVPICLHSKYHNGVRSYNCAFENVQRLNTWYLKKGFGTPSFARSLQLFTALKSLKEMRTEDIACLPKDFILAFASEDIDNVWSKLPEEIRMDKNVMDYRRCQKHFKKINDGSDDFDGPIPLIKNCADCQYSSDYI